jgi:hypothetical protein
VEIVSKGDYGSILMDIKSATIMFIAPTKRNDPVFYTHQWATNAIRMTKSLGYKVIELHGDNVTYRNVNAAIEKYKPRLFVAFSHGCPPSINGQNECAIARKFSVDELMTMEPVKLDRLLNPVKLSGCGKDICQLQNNVCQPLCSNPTNINSLKDSIVYAVSCHTAEILGKCAIQYGVQSYVGYNDLLLFPVDQMRSQDMFGQIHLEFLRYLLTGYSVGEANEAMKRMEDTYIRLYRQTKWVALPALWNALHREVLGDPTATIY